MSELEASFAANEALWDAWSRLHETSAFYDLEGFRRGGIRLTDEDLAGVGDVDGKSLLHLQCHFGLDTLSWARRGARVTGADLSREGIELAQRLAIELGFPGARFVRSNVYDLPDVLDGTFDVVYTSRGALDWLPDIRGWARVVAHFVAPGGLFFIHEIHPVVNAFADEDVSRGELRLAYRYWEEREPFVFPVEGSYADPDADLGQELAGHGWNHGLGEIVTALIDAGLRIDSLVEHDRLSWPLPFLVPDPERPGSYRLPPESAGSIPLMYSLRASRPSA